MSEENVKELPEHVRDTQGGDEGRDEDQTLKLKSRSDDEKVRDGEKDPSVPQVTQVQEKQIKDANEKGTQKVPSGKVVNPDEETAPARNDPNHPTVGELDRDQSLGFTDRTEQERDATQTQADHVPDAPHREPSTYTPSGARPGQQNPVNPQGSPGADPFDPNVGARPFEGQPQVVEGRDGDYTKITTPGEKNPSQRPYEIDHQPTTHNEY